MLINGKLSEISTPHPMGCGVLISLILLVMTYLGIDYGSKRIGLAIASDETPPVPYRTLGMRNWELGIREVVDVVGKEHVDVIVIGRPKAMTTTDRRTEIERETEKFVEALQDQLLQSQISIPLYWVDERLTTKQAEALKREYGQSGDRDAVSAMLIVETYLLRRK